MNHPQQLTKKHLLRRMLICLALVFIAGITWSGYWWYQIDQTIQKAVPRHADVGIVLGAAVWGEGPSPGLRERLELALALYQAGYVPNLLVSGGLGEGKKVTEAAVMRDYLLSKGVPPEHILLESSSTNTYENLLFSQQVMNDHDFHEAVLISHDYHLTRAVVMAESLGMNVSPVGVESKVLFGPYHRAREVLAITYWQFTHLLSRTLGTLVLA